ncbi:glycosyltransferase [uncultured Tateyamaria sp.]|uniref:glycosyltransferase n=1 Tax=uncultured Tateyamaria sp. TaxID=455651 RepID=UPI00262919EE|nr:glycosyltransferase [uncultured Tateyamaria sp.]
MKISFCVSSFPALSQTFVTSQVLHAVRNGHDVTVICKAMEADTLLSPEDREALRRVRIVIWPSPKVSLLTFLPTALRDRLVARLDRDAWRRQIDADFVIAHFGYRGAAVARAQRGWRQRPPLVTVFHGRDVSVELRRDRMARYQDLFAEGDLHLTVNTPFAKQLISCGAPDARVESHHLGIPVSRYQFSIPDREGALRFLSVCRLVEKKGLDVAIDALALLHDRHPEIDWRYDIGGEGPLAAALKAQVALAGLESRVSFVGALPHEEVLQRMSKADALLAPSVTAADGDQEGIPVTLMEAMALGTPVCTTRHSGIPELVSHGDTGFLSDERDVEGLYANILSLVQNPQMAATMARAARGKIESKFNEDRQNARLIGRCEMLTAVPQDAAIKMSVPVVK